MPNIVMLLSNAFRPDMRVLKEANSLAEAGYNVTLICWDRQCELPEEETLPDGVQIVRIRNVRTVYGAGLRQTLYTPRFWSSAVKRAIPYKPELVHCHDLDTLYAGIRIKHQLGCKLLLDAHEDYPTQMSLYLPRIFVPGLNFLERLWLHQVDAAVAASSLYIEKLNSIGISPAVYLPNVPDQAVNKGLSQEEVSQKRRELGLESAYVVAYIGGFSRNRMLLPLIEAMRSLPEVTLLLAGDGHQRQVIENSTRGMANVRYLGWLPAEQVPLFTCLSDVIYYCLKPDYPGAKYNAPNTLSNAMAAGRPVIANNLGDLGRIVQKTDCGLLLDEVTPQTIAQAIVELADPVVRSKLGEAGRMAAQQEYNWQVVRQRLLDLYSSMLLQS